MNMGSVQEALGRAVVAGMAIGRSRNEVIRLIADLRPAGELEAVGALEAALSALDLAHLQVGAAEASLEDRFITLGGRSA